MDIVKFIIGALEVACIIAIFCVPFMAYFKLDTIEKILKDKYKESEEDKEIKRNCEGCLLYKEGSTLTSSCDKCTRNPLYFDMYCDHVTTIEEIRKGE